MRGLDGWAARFVGYSRPAAGRGVAGRGARLWRILGAGEATWPGWVGLRVDERRDQRPLADCRAYRLDGRVEERGSAEGRRRAAVGGSRRAELGASRAVRVFSKKLLRRRGVFFGGVWRRGARTGFRLNTPEWRVGCGGMLFGGDWGAVEHNDWMHVGPARPGARRWVGRAWLDGVGRKARGRRANVGRRGTNGGRASGGRRAAIGGGRRRTGSRPSADGIERRRRASSRSRSEAAGIWRSGCEAYSASVHYLRTNGKF